MHIEWKLRCHDESWMSKWKILTGVKMNTTKQTDDQKTFMDAIKSYEGESELCGESLKIWLKNIPVLNIFKNSLASHAVLLRKFFDFLENRKIAFVLHESGYLQNLLAITFFEGNAREAAITMIPSYITEHSSSPSAMNILSMQKIWAQAIWSQKNRKSRVPGTC